jgi:hypothetical protein
MKRPDRPPIEVLDEHYRQLATQLAQVGYMLKGTVSKRLTRCGNRGCQCRAEPPQLHGPYWQWSALVDGKTVTRLIAAEQVPIYQEWIENRRRAEEFLHQMQEISSQAAALLLPKTSTSAASKGADPPRTPQPRPERHFVRGK